MIFLKYYVLKPSSKKYPSWIKPNYAWYKCVTMEEIQRLEELKIVLREKQQILKRILQVYLKMKHVL